MKFDYTTPRTVGAVIDLRYGDCGKGAVCYAMLSLFSFTHVLRFNGGGNAGHTIYHNDKKLITHQIPCGVLKGIKSVIGAGCVIDPVKLLEEIQYLESNGVENVRSLLKIAKNAHLVTSTHKEEETGEAKIGTTKTGNGPAYRDKYNRTGVRAESLKTSSVFAPMLIDVYDEFYNTKEPVRVLAEGAQGFYLDVDWGDYPYVTSSNCGVSAVLQNGFSHRDIGFVAGVAKAYDTYVGAKTFETPNDPILQKLREVGQEYGSTTGRPRQCNWLNVDETIRAARMNGVEDIYVKKLDVLSAVGVWKFIHNGQLITCKSEKDFTAEVGERIAAETQACVSFSKNPKGI